MSDTDQVTIGANPAIEQWWNQYRERLDSSERNRITVYVRSLSPSAGGHDRRRRLRDAIRDVSAEAAVDSLEVSVLGEEICLCDQCVEAVVDEDVLRTVNELRGWRGGGIRATGFTEREVDSSITGEDYRTVVPPEVSLGVHVGGSLVGVFPCAAEGETFAPEDFFERLLSSRPEEPEQRDEQFLSAVDD